LRSATEKSDGKFISFAVAMKPSGGLNFAAAHRADESGPLVAHISDGVRITVRLVDAVCAVLPFNRLGRACV
jgi:hypothetical protein